MPKTIIFLLLIVNCKALAQTITGKVQDSENKAVPLANVLLLQAKDSSLVKGSVSDASGKYVIEILRPGTYLLAISRIGFNQQYTTPFSITAKSQMVIPAFTLTAATKQLNEVTVMGKRPFVENKIDRLVVNVANSIIASGSTALEVLEKAPGITVDRQNDQISLRGKEGVIVQIDGKQTYLPMADVVALLRNMPSDNIDRIELITNPSAKYDAAGNSGIIDIRLKKDNNVGTNGSASIGAGSGRYHRERASLQVNHRASKFNLFANLSANRGGNYADFDVIRDQADGSQRNIITSLSYIRHRISAQNLKVGLDYFLSKNTTVGVVWTGFWNQPKQLGSAHAIFQRQENGPVYLHTLTPTTLLNYASNQLGNVNVQHSFKKNKAVWSADFDIGRFTRNYENFLSTETLIPSSPAQPVTGLITNMPTNIDIVTFRTDYSQPIKANWKIEAGLKSSSVSSDNNLELNSGLNGNFKRDSTLSNHFKYTEKVNAAYVTLNGKLGAKTEVMFGVRAEHTHSIGNSITFNNVVNRYYLNVFPSIFLSRSLNKNHRLTGSYSYRIDRPNYQSLNPARSYLDPYTYGEGNAFLKPQYTQSIELKHGFKDKIFTSLAASYVTDLQFYVIQPIDGIMARRMPENIGKSQAYSLTVSFPVTVRKGWTIQGTLMGNYSRFDYTYKGSPVQVQQISGRLNVSNSIVLNKSWTAELTGWLNTPAVKALSHAPWLGTFDAGIQKTINKRWKAKLSGQDILHTNKILERIEAPNFSSRVRIGIDTRIVMLNLTYNFGNQQLKTLRQKKTASEEEVQRTN